MGVCVVNNFDSFWVVFPKKSDKQISEKLFNALSEGLQKTIINDVLDRKAHHDQWKDKQFVPSPARYLRRELYKDDIVQARTKEMDQAENEDGSVHARLWTMLIQFYGQKFINSFGEKMPPAWRFGLIDLSQKECSKILRHLSTDNCEFMPDLPKICRIRNIGRQSWRTDQKLIGNPATIETVSEQLNAMKRMLK